MAISRPLRRTDPPARAWFCPACAAPNGGAATRCAACGGAAERRPLAADPDHRGRRAAGARLVLALVPLLLLAVAVAGLAAAERAGQAAQYARAEAAAAGGRYEEAVAAFAAAGEHRDAPARRAAFAAALAPAAAGRDRAAAALAAGDAEAAIAALRPVVRALPGDEEASALLAEARGRRRADLVQAAAAAEAGRDWLAAERALAELAADPAASSPGQPDPAARLAALRRQHAPLLLARDRALWLVGPDGADDRLLLDGIPAARPVWSPDRSTVAFLSAAEDGGRGASTLYVVGADGRNPRRVSAGVHPNALPAWSPDGGRIAYTSVAAWDLRRGEGRLAVHVVDVATGANRDVTAALDAEQVAGGAVRHAMSPWWTPDGRLAVIARAAGVDPNRPAEGAGDLFLLDLARGTAANLTQGRVPDLLRAFWSPRGDRALLWTRAWRAAGGALESRADLLLLDPATGALTPAAEGIDTPATGWTPAWAPDGERFAFFDGASTLVLQDEAGGQRRLDLDGDFSGALSWAPGGGALFAAATDPGRPSVVIDLAAPGFAITPLPLAYDADWRTGSPQWAPVLPTPDPAPPGLDGTGLDPARTAAAAAATD